MSLSEVVREFASRLSYPLDQFQVAACEELAAGGSVLVAAPTGSGKTTVAEFAVYMGLMHTQQRVFYTAPIKALSNQKFHELVEQYGEEAVGLLTGDVNIRGDARVVVMTTEVLRNMVYEESSDLAELGFVVLDEVHFLGDKHRGPVWEEVILHLPQHVRLVSLSATVSNAEEFGDWLQEVRGSTAVIISEKRPVPLYQHVLTERELLPLFVDKRGQIALGGRINPEILRLAPRRGEGAGRRRARGGPPRRSRVRISRADIVRSLDEAGLLPAIVFVFSRSGCEQAVWQCAMQGVRLTTREEREEIRRVAEAELAGMSAEERKVIGAREWLGGLERGVAAHHAGLLPGMKAVVEQLFQRRLLKVVFATETLALGINMPARAVVLERLDKFNGEGRVPLTSGEYTQLTGRAGRRGIDTVGHAIVVWRDGLDVQALSHLAGARSFPVMSRFSPTPNMAVNLLQRFTREQATELLELSFAQFQVDREVVERARELSRAKQSLAGYDRAAAEATTRAERERWVERARKLRRQVNRGSRQIERRTGQLARVFERVLELLQARGYVDDAGGGELSVTAWGEVLSRVYGERDLLITECLRQGHFAGLSPQQLAAVACYLSYEPKREEGAPYRMPGGRQLARVFDEILYLWVAIDDQQDALRLTRTEPPHAGLAGAMYAWAGGAPIDDVLELAGLPVGDFVRTAKLTIDLLEQLARLRDVAELLPERECEQLLQVSSVARQAKRLARRGIVEASMVAGLTAGDAEEAEEAEAADGAAEEAADETADEPEAAEDTPHA